MLGFTPTGPQPVIRNRTWIALTAVALGAPLIILGILGYIFRQAIFQSEWEHGTNAIALKYNEDYAAFYPGFATIDMASLTDESRSQHLQKELSTSRSTVDSVIADTDKIVAYLDLKEGTLSAKDETSRALYRECFAGRKKGVTLLSTGIDNSLGYVSAFNSLESYKAEINNFAASKAALKQALLDKKESTTTLEALNKERTSAVTLKSYLDSAETILGYDSLKTQSQGYQMIIGGLSDVEISMLKKDPKSLNKGTGEIESGQKLIDDTSDQALVDWKMWFRDKIKASYDNGNKEFHNVNDVCTQAEASTYLYKENSPMLLLINTVKQR